MELYSIEKGRHYFNGNRIQPIFFQIFGVVTCLFAAVYFNTWWLIGLAALIFICIYSVSSSEIVSESKAVYFFPSCAYQLENKYDQVNKLFGFAEGPHHLNSARIGWRCVDGINIELFAYAYVNGKRTITPMISCKTDSWIFCTIQNHKNEYIFKTVNPKSNSMVVTIQKGPNAKFYNLFKLFIYKLYPYFGGKMVAPHAMSMYVTKITLK